MDGKFLASFTDPEREAFRAFIESPGVNVILKYLLVRKTMIATNSMDPTASEDHFKFLQGKYSALTEFRETLKSAAAESNNR